MRSALKLLARLAALIFLLSGLLLAFGAAAPAGNPKAPGPATAAPYDEEAAAEAPTLPLPPGFKGALDIRCQSEEGRVSPPVEMVLSNPYGETVGYDPRYQTAYQEIPGASYKREVVPGYPEIEAEVLNVRAPVSGTYSLRVIGVETGTYSLFIKGVDRHGNQVDLQFTHANIKPGYIHHYLIKYSQRQGPSLEARRTLITE